MLDRYVTEFHIGLFNALKTTINAANLPCEFEFPETVMQPKQLGIQKSHTNNQPSKPNEMIVLSGVLYDLNEGKQKGLRSRRPVIQITAFSNSAIAALELRKKAESAISESFEYEFCESYRFIGIRGSFFDRSTRLHVASRDVEFLVKPCPLR